MPIPRSVSSARALASFFDRSGSWIFRTSSKCEEIFISGFSRVIGSWKIIPRSGPRSCGELLAA